MRKLIVVAVCFLAACHVASPATRTTATVPPPVVPVSTVVPDPTAFADAAVSTEVLGALPPIEQGYANRVVGYSRDDAYLGYEISTCDPCPSTFYFDSKTRPPIALSYYYDPEFESTHPNAAEKRRKKNDEAVDAKIAELGVEKSADMKPGLRGPFPYPDLRFASRSTRDDRTGEVTLWFGASASGAEPVYPMHVTLAAHPMYALPASERARIAKLAPAERESETRTWHEQFQMGDASLIYANVTHDGSEIGIVAFSLGTMWFEAAGVARMPTATFVAEVRSAKVSDVRAKP